MHGCIFYDIILRKKSYFLTLGELEPEQWFMGETLCDYIFLTGHDLHIDRGLVGRFASIKVVFF